ncbi:MAG: hypothetical protein E6G03_12960 [Actinobacteria bacterium]|nr:MAG: hypothetical protein E6G03_12960 [Actinomycetota bacterium]
MADAALRRASTRRRRSAIAEPVTRRHSSEQGRRHSRRPAGIEAKTAPAIAAASLQQGWEPRFDLVARLFAHWSDALDVAERAVTTAEIARSLQPVDLYRFRRHLREERAWLVRLDLAAPRCSSIRRTTQPRSALARMAERVPGRTMESHKPT